MSPAEAGPPRTWVLDASALLAMLHGEPGGEAVPPLLAGAVMSSVNWSEVIQKALDREVEVTGLREDVEALGLAILPFTVDQAERTARLRAYTRELGLSLADRACLALASELGLSAVTTDRAWGEASLGLEVRLLR